MLFWSQACWIRFMLATYSKRRASASPVSARFDCSWAVTALASAFWRCSSASRRAATSLA